MQQDKPKKKPRRTYQQLAAVAKTAVDEALDKMDVATVRIMVQQTVERAAKEIIYKLLGFDYTRWSNNWELRQHRDSIAVQYLHDKFAPAIKTWLDEQVPNLPPLPKTAVKSLRNRYLDELEEHVGRHLDELARERASNVAEQIVAEVLNTENPENG